MGAAGYVSIYDVDELEAVYKRHYPDRSIHDDWTYLKTITAEVNGKRIALDYSDDQGMHDGIDNDFWFAYDEKDPRAAHKRVLRCVKGHLWLYREDADEEFEDAVVPIDTIEVWT